MKNEPINWDEVSDFITKEQFYRLCHISKTTALQLLRSGKVPCAYSGKKTRCYRIRKEDVQKYLEERAIFPEAYSAPIGWYCKGDKRAAKPVPPIIMEDMSDYYTHTLTAYPDVLTVQQIAIYTGYSKTAINQWCGKDWLKHFKLGRANMVPKVFLVEFLCSVHYRAINQKTDRHIKLLKGFRRWKRADKTL